MALLSPRLVTPIASVVGAPLERLRGIPGRLARENAVRNPGRTASTAAALMIGLALVSFVTVFAAGLKGSIDDAIDKTITGDLIVSNDDGFSDIPVATVDAVAGVDGVEVASPLRYTQDERRGRSAAGYLTLVDPTTAAEVLTLDWKRGLAGAAHRASGPTDAVIDEKWGDDNGLGVGDTFERQDAPRARRSTYTVTRHLQGQHRLHRRLRGLGRQRRAPTARASNATNVFVKLDAGRRRGDGAQATIDDALADAVPDRRSPRTSRSSRTRSPSSSTRCSASSTRCCCSSVIVSLFGIVNTLALSIHERTRELGLLRAVGTSRRQVRRIVRYEAVITALIGAVLGAVLGVVFAVIVSRPLADEGFILTIPVGTLIVLLVLAVDRRA